MSVKAALLDAQGIYLRMEELADESQLTDRHLPTITSCDLPAGKYQWIADVRNPYGGSFFEVEWLDNIAKTRREAQAPPPAAKRRRGRA